MQREREREKLQLVDLSSYDFDTLYNVIMLIKLVELVIDGEFVVGKFKTTFQFKFSAKKKTNKKTEKTSIIPVWLTWSWDFQYFCKIIKFNVTWMRHKCSHMIFFKSILVESHFLLMQSNQWGFIV